MKRYIILGFLIASLFIGAGSLIALNVYDMTPIWLKSSGSLTWPTGRADITLQNEETIDNTTNGTINLTATTIKATGNLQVTGTYTVAGIGNTGTFRQGGNATFDSNVVLGKTSADYVVFGGVIPDDSKLTFGTGSDITMEYDENGDNDLQIVGNVSFDDSVILGATSADLITPNGVIPDDTALVFGTGSDTSIQYDEDGDDDLQVNGNMGLVNDLAVDGSVTLGNAAADLITPNGVIPDDTTLIFGTGSDATIQYDENGDDVLQITGATTFDSAVVCDGSVTLGDAAADLITPNGVIPDDTTLIFGTGSEITLQYDEDGENVLQVTGPTTFDGAVVCDGAVTLGDAVTDVIAPIGAIADNDTLNFGDVAEGTIQYDANGTEKLQLGTAAVLCDYNIQIGAIAGCDYLRPATETGTSYLHVFRGNFDATGGIAQPATVSLGYIPDNAIITMGYYIVTTAFESAGSTATIALGVNTDDTDGIVAAIAINDGSSPWNAGNFAIIQDGAVGNFSTITSAKRSIDAAVAVQDLTAGELYVYLEYIVTE